MGNLVIENMPNRRLLYVDALKGFTILLVVLGHVLQVRYNTDNLLYRYIHSFHMPLFMFLSGYVSYRVMAWGNIGKRFLQLIIPFFSYIVITYFINCPDISFRSLGDYITKIILRPDYGLWFLWALFFINTVFVCCRKLAVVTHVNEWCIILFVAGFLNLIEFATNFKTFGYHWIAWYFIFFVCGVYWRLFNSICRIKSDMYLFVGCAILFPICAYYFRISGTPPPLVF